MSTRGWWAIIRRVKDELAEDHTTLSAAGVAFYFFLSMIPAMSAGVSIYGLVADPQQVQERARSLFGTLPEEARQLLTEQLTAIVSSSGGALTFSLISSLVLSLYSASSGFGHLVEAIKVAYDDREKRGFLKERALALLVTVVAVVGFAVAVATVVLCAWLAGQLAAAPVLAWLLRLAWLPVIVVGFVAALSALYRLAPTRVAARGRWVSVGSVVAVLIWITASVGFQVYVTNFGSYNETYGSLAAVVVLLFWLFLTAFAILLGAQINAEIEHRTGPGTTVVPSRDPGERDVVTADSGPATLHRHAWPSNQPS